MRTFVRVALVTAVLAGCGGPQPTPVVNPPAATTPTDHPVPSSASDPSGTPGPSVPAVACGGPVTDARWWSDRVFYEVFVRSFGDSNGDGSGDLQGLTARLDYLNDGDPVTTDDLGITGIWLMPVAEATSYHGYDVTDYTAVERDYGTLADLQAFVRAAHDRGIAVILDLVLNHTSSDHPWFRASRDPASPKADWYLWSDTDPGYPGPFGRSAWHPDGGRWYYGAFGGHMPDLDLRNPAVTEALVEAAGFWMTEVGVDGFRLDAIRHLIENGPDQVNTPESLAWLTAFRDRLRAMDPDVLLVGEVMDITAASAPFVREGAVDLTFDFPLARGFLQAPNLEDIAPLAGARRDVLEWYPAGGYAALLTNHDQTRAMSEYGGRVEKARLGASLLLTDPGVPFIYYGEEIGMEGRKPDERLRAPMPWTGDAPSGGFSAVAPWQPMPDGWPETNVAAQAGDPGSLLSAYRDLVRLRTDHAALRTGATFPVDADPTSLVAMLRSDARESVLVLTNLGLAPVTDYTLTLDAGPLCAAGGATVLYGPADLGPLTAPTPGPAGGFAAWTPVAAIPAQTTLVIGLRP